MKNRVAFFAAAVGSVLAAGLCQAAEVSAPAEPMSVWFASPARSFHESCPLGNGRLGAMDFGGVGRERIVLNESSVWSGGPYDGNKYDAYQCLPEVREKLFAGDISGAGAALEQRLPLRRRRQRMGGCQPVRLLPDAWRSDRRFRQQPGGEALLPQRTRCRRRKRH